MHAPDIRKDAQEVAADQSPSAEPTAPVAAWQEIETGRYMPQRIRGSCIGRALG
jgi:hypothetical protein